MIEENGWKVSYIGDNFLEITARFLDSEVEKLVEFETKVFENFSGIIPTKRERIFIPEIIELQ